MTSEKMATGRGVINALEAGGLEPVCDADGVTTAICPACKHPTKTLVVTTAPPRTYCTQGCSWNESLRRLLIEAAGELAFSGRPAADCALQALVAEIDHAAAAKPPALGFQRAVDRLKGEHQERLQMGSRVLPFGISYLDKASGGITPNDLIVVGSKTGHGKTAFGTIVALHNCRRGRRIHYFALEAEGREIERRMKFQLLTERYFANRLPGSPVNIRYLDWYLGKLDGVLGRYEEWADQELGRALANFYTYYRDESFTAEDFCASLEEIKDETDLVVLDHLHYVDTDDENENRGYKTMVKRIRDAALRIGRPVIVMAHVRKGERRFETLIPTIEDIHGSSDVVKIATKAIILAAAYDRPHPDDFLWNTYVQIGKCRPDGTVARFAAICQFNARGNFYEDDFALGRMVEGGRKFEELPRAEWPAWAKDGTR